MLIKNISLILRISEIIKDMGDSYIETEVDRHGELIIYSTNLDPHYYVMRWQGCLDKSKICELSSVSAEDCKREYEERSKQEYAHLKLSK